MELPNQVFAGFAGWLGYADKERAALWAARLQLSQPGIEFFRTFALPAANAYVAASPVLEAPCGLPGPRQAEPAETLDPATPFAPACRHPEWHIFIKPADGIPICMPVVGRSGVEAARPPGATYARS